MSDLGEIMNICGSGIMQRSCQSLEFLLWTQLAKEVKLLTQSCYLKINIVITIFWRRTKKYVKAVGRLKNKSFEISRQVVEN